MDPVMARQTMVKEQLQARGITDQYLLDAFLKVPRHMFVDAYLKYKAYDDYPLTIGHGQTISQPYMVALMTASLRPEPDQRILEIGTGSGYQSAILSRLYDQVYSIERIRQLAAKARKVHDQLGYYNIVTRIGDGTRGLPQFAPYDGILVTAGAPVIPEALMSQLSDGGRLIIPVGDEYIQELKRITREGDEFKEESLGGCRFVKLIGEAGWKE